MVMNRVHNIFNVDIFKEVYKDDLSCMNRYYVLLCKNMSWWYLEISHVNLKLKSLSLSLSLSHSHSHIHVMYIVFCFLC
jgi:hypothetical protein